MATRSDADPGVASPSNQLGLTLMARRRPYQRTDRLNRQVKEVLATALQMETREDVLREVIVTDVEVTRDLSLARVFYYPMQPTRLLEVEEALARAGGFLRGRVGQEIRMRQTPELRFIYDESIDRGRRVEHILGTLDIAPEGEDVEPGPGEADLEPGSEPG